MILKKPLNDVALTAMIPARMGSTRLAMKNLALLDGKPLIYYAVRAARESGVFDRIVINSENDIFEKIALRYKVDYYRRPAQFATSGARSDSVVYDFMRNNPSDIVVWVNTTSPLQTGYDIRGAVEYFLKEGLDSLITIKNEQVHCFYRGKPVNFRTDRIFDRTQDLTPVQSFVYSLMMWRSEIFIKMYEKKGRALFCGKFGVYPVRKDSTVIIKREEDLILADHILCSRKKRKKFSLKYDKIINRSEGKYK